MSTVADIIRCPGEVLEPQLRHANIRASWIWKAPDIGTIKINMDDSYLIGSGKEGIGGIFKDLDYSSLVC